MKLIAAVFAFVNVNLIPMDTERVVPGQTVVVSGDRIVAIGSAGNMVRGTWMTRDDLQRRLALDPTSRVTLTFVRH